MTIPLDWLGEFHGSIEAIEPPEDFFRITYSQFFIFKWQSGFLWIKQYEEKREFFRKRMDWYWTGTHFDKVKAALSLQLTAACEEALAKKAALRQSGLS